MANQHDRMSHNFGSRQDYVPYTSCVGFCTSVGYDTNYGLKNDDYFSINYYDGRCWLRLKGKEYQFSILFYESIKDLLRSIFL